MAHAAQDRLRSLFPSAEKAIEGPHSDTDMTLINHMQHEQEELHGGGL